ncbi:hypothetical protein NECAME_14757 [Necator americanus]|uniref:Uncharacterized protein n=1 Tax=Necator americanus TaxID=51031 RepID=W2SLM8_NECAM|nr:hypothetical protein NECAME_14757 [Necator americanus]ETN70448.1 hypothetical protein NECAME_14757 [Necator americanus]
MFLSVTDVMVIPCERERGNSSKTASLPRGIYNRRLSTLPPSLAVSGRLEMWFVKNTEARFQKGQGQGINNR